MTATAAQAIEEAGPARTAAEARARPRLVRRGPMRPARLLSARERQSGRMAVRYLQAADAAAIHGGALMTVLVATAGAWQTAQAGLIAPLLAAPLVTAWALRTAGAYAVAGREPPLPRPAALALGVGIGALAGLAVAALTPAPSEPATLIALWGTATLAALAVLHLLWRPTLARWRAEGRLTANVVIVGATRHAERLIAQALERRDINVLGVFDDRLARSPGDIRGVPVLGDTAALVAHRMIPSVDRIVVALDPSARSRVRAVVDRLKVLPNEVSLLVDLDDDQHRDAALDRLAQRPLARLSGHDADDRRAFQKRVQDLAIGTAALIGFAPVMLAVAAAIRLEDGGPIFFRQRRQGFNNEEILVWKFRSMRTDAADATASRQVVADDERITRVGRLIRRTGLDELPQLFNVLRGEMSLVGPRPHAIGMKTGDAVSAELVAEYAWRHRLKPGITGWAAVNGSRGPLHTPEDVRRRVALDVEYVERQSLWLDLWILFRTVPMLLGDRSAVR